MPPCHSGARLHRHDTGEKHPCFVFCCSPDDPWTTTKTFLSHPTTHTNETKNNPHGLGVHIQASKKYKKRSTDLGLRCPVIKNCASVKPWYAPRNLGVASPTPRSNTNPRAMHFASVGVPTVTTATAAVPVVGLHKLFHPPWLHFSCLLGWVRFLLRCVPGFRVCSAPQSAFPAHRRSIPKPS